MNILCISNFYPSPHTESAGGYELWCREVSERLCQSGHTVWVLTSPEETHQDTDNGYPLIIRSVELELAAQTGQAWRQFFVGRRRREQRCLCALQEAVAALGPDVILIWGMWNLPVSLAALAEQLARVVYYVGDIWPTLVSQYHLYLQEPSQNPRRVLLKQLLQTVAPLWLPRPVRAVEVLRFDHVLCPSLYLRDLLAGAGIPGENLHVVPGAIDTTRFTSRSETQRMSSYGSGALALLWVGRLVSGKGVETAIQALGLLTQHHPDLGRVTLTIVGDGGKGYVSELKALTAQLNVSSRVDFIGAVPSHDIPNLYAGFDAFVFTSTLQESFGRVLVEAMASGLPVIASSAGGVQETLENGAFGLMYAPGDAAGLTAQIARLATDIDLRQRLADAGEIRARQFYDIRHMTERIETQIRSVVSQR